MLELSKAKASLDRMLRQKEGEKLAPYLCKAGVPTIGVGATHYPDGRKVQMSDPAISAERMAEMLSTEIDRYVDAVLGMVNHVCTTGQLVALVLLGYNIGLHGLAESTVVKKHNEGDYISAANAFKLWDKIKDPRTGKLVQEPALFARRTYESAVYLSDSVSQAKVPQAVAPESSLAKSPIIQAAATVASGGATVLAAAPEAPKLPVGLDPAEALAKANTLAEHANVLAASLHINLWWVLGFALCTSGAVSAYWRWKQRQGGYA
jgi:lysozyme